MFESDDELLIMNDNLSDKSDFSYGLNDSVD